MAKIIKKIEEEVIEKVVPTPEIPVTIPVSELQELLNIHKLMTEKGIKDIGTLEVLISRLQ